MIAAVPLMVDLVEGDPVEEDLGVGQRVEGHADPAHLLGDVGVVGVIADLGRQVGGHRQAGAAPLQQVLVTGVGVVGRAEPAVLAERPQLVAVPGGEVAPGERERARIGDVGVVQIGRRRAVERLHRNSGFGRDRGPVVVLAHPVPLR
jgi:hypothetical protein